MLGLNEKKDRIYASFSRGFNEPAYGSGLVSMIRTVDDINPALP